MSVPIEMSPRQGLCWAAGLLEGEGAFYVAHTPSGPRGRVQCRLGDRDVLGQLRSVLGCGYVNGPYESSEQALGGGLSWIYQVNRQAEVARIAATLKPLMSRRRQNQIAAMLAEMGMLPVETEGGRS